MDEVKAGKEKICHEEDCATLWEEISPELRKQCVTFVYCPFCANEMVTRCSACGEAIHESEYKYCPWCGAVFEE